MVRETGVDPVERRVRRLQLASQLPGAVDAMGIEVEGTIVGHHPRGTRHRPRRSGRGAGSRVAAVENQCLLSTINSCPMIDPCWSNQFRRLFALRSARCHLTV